MTFRPTMTLRIEAIDLMLDDLGLTDEGLSHRAAFHGCSRELLALRQELREFLVTCRIGGVQSPQSPRGG
ncbi:MAG: hypothetical protein ACKOZW_02765 [Cyanobium sp.]